MRELVLTGAAALWPADECGALFLGPWCFAHHERHAYEDYERFDLAPPPDASGDRVCRDADHVAALCERLLPSLSEWLNELHGVRHTPRFWRIIAINWLVHWVGACWDRYQRFRLLAGGMADGERLSVKIIGRDLVRCETTQGFIAQLADHAYNLQLMSDLLRASGEFAFIERVETDDVGSLGGVAPGGISAARAEARGSSARAGDALAAWVLPRMRARCHLGHIYGVDRLDKLRILAAVDPFACVRLSRRSRNVEPIVCDRARLLAQSFLLDCRDDFERVLCEILPSHLPNSFLSYYPSDRRRLALRQIRIGSGTHEPLDRLYEIAHLVEAGGRWMSVQHGGGYGQARCLGMENVEYETPGEFVTWGWSGTENSAVRFRPVPSPQLSKLPRRHAEGRGLLLAGTMVPAYHYRFHSVLQPEGILAYLRGKTRFIRHLHAQPGASLVYRPYGLNDYGVGDAQHVRSAIPDCRITEKGTLVDGLCRTRLAVFDHIGTGFLEALAMDVPLVLYWDPAVFAVSAEARPFFDALRSADLLHDTPEAAAAHVNRVWDDVEGWWRQPLVRDAVEAFRNRFARTSGHWRRDWAAFIRARLR